MYKKLLLLVAVMMSYNATTNSMARSIFSTLFDNSKYTLLAGTLYGVSILAEEKSFDQETMWPLAKLVLVSALVNMGVNGASTLISKSIGQWYCTFESSIASSSIAPDENREYCPSSFDGAPCNNHNENSKRYTLAKAAYDYSYILGAACGIGWIAYNRA